MIMMIMMMMTMMTNAIPYRCTKSHIYEVTYLYISGITTKPKLSECDVNSYNRDTIAMIWDFVRMGFWTPHAMVMMMMMMKIIC